MSKNTTPYTDMTGDRWCDFHESCECPPTSRARVQLRWKLCERAWKGYIKSYFESELRARAVVCDCADRRIPYRLTAKGKRALDLISTKCHTDCMIDRGSR